MITTHDELVDIVRRILFIPIQHSTINYPVSYYGAFTPNMPTKLYDPNTQDFTIENLPQYNIVSVRLNYILLISHLCSYTCSNLKSNWSLVNLDGVTAITLLFLYFMYQISMRIRIGP